MPVFMSKTYSKVTPDSDTVFQDIMLLSTVKYILCMTL